MRDSCFLQALVLDYTSGDTIYVDAEFIYDDLEDIYKGESIDMRVQRNNNSKHQDEPYITFIKE